MLTETRERFAKSEREVFTRGETDYIIRSHESYIFTAYRIAGEWVEPTGTRGARKEREYQRKGYACITVATGHTNAVSVACGEDCKPVRVTLVRVSVTGEPDAVRDYLDTLTAVRNVREIPNGYEWEMML